MTHWINVYFDGKQSKLKSEGYLQESVRFGCVVDLEQGGARSGDTVRFYEREVGTDAVSHYIDRTVKHVISRDEWVNKNGSRTYWRHQVVCIFDQSEPIELVDALEKGESG